MDWTRKDLETVAKALSEVNELFWKKAELHRAQASSSKGNVATSADGIIVLYDRAFEDKKMLPRYLTHELAHQLYLSMPDSEKTEY